MRDAIVFFTSKVSSQRELDSCQIIEEMDPYLWIINNVEIVSCVDSIFQTTANNTSLA